MRSTAGSSSGTSDDDDDRSGGSGSFMETAKTFASAAAGAAFLAWGISKMLSPTPYKMKTDGSCHPVSSSSNSNSNSNYNNLSQDVVLRGPSGYGGVLRDHDGKWVLGFIGFIGEADCLTSELYGILNGLRILDKPNRYGSILETDSQAAYEWVKERNRDPKLAKSRIIVNSSDIIMECRRLADKNNISVKHINKNDNKCADKLANIAVQEEEEYMEIKYPSKEFDYLVEAYGNFNN